MIVKYFKIVTENNYNFNKVYNLVYKLISFVKKITSLQNCQSNATLQFLTFNLQLKCYEIYNFTNVIYWLQITITICNFKLQLQFTITI